MIKDLQSTAIIEEDESGRFSFANSSVANGRAETEKQEMIAKKEDIAVFRLRLVTILVLTASTVAVALMVFKYITTSENDEFESQFAADANKVLDAIGSSIDVSLGAIDAMVVSMVSYAKDSNSSWPYVTLPDFAVRAKKIRSLSNAVVMNVYCLVSSEERLQWQNYTAENNWWVNETIGIQAKDDTFYGPISWNWTESNVIHDGIYDRAYNYSRYLATWQSFPIVVEDFFPYNWDLLSVVDTTSLDAIFERKQVVISEAYHLPDPEDLAYVEETEHSVGWYSNLVHPGQDPSEPISDLYYPIMDSAIDTIRLSNLDDDEEGNLVGIFGLSIYWIDFIKDILPPGSDGIIVVFENECNPTFTFQVDGSEATFLGRGDFHDKKYDHLEVSSWLMDLSDFSLKDRRYTGIPLDRQFCPFFIRVFPSQIMEDDHTTNDAIIFTASAVGIFLFASIVFLFYDNLVERRQTKVMRTAVESTAIVTSLFPSNVRDRLFGSDLDDKEKKGKKDKKEKKQKKDFRASQNQSLGVSSSHSAVKEDGSNSAESSKSGSPIADLYPEATVMFGDIAGFTAWSSARSPTQVFTLLETIYGAFDVIADRKGVFKVETIGDSYVAVVGLPVPRPNHAIIMAKFAHACKEKFDLLTRELETTLGPDTGDLRMRFGLNSGPVTAGVLRGQKSRFQLFGDTVNTAARMESNSAPGMIMASQSTADALIAGGKARWVREREDLIEAKGKGLMQVYWIEPSFLSESIRTNESVDVLGTDYLDEKTSRLIDWNMDILSKLLSQIVAQRGTTKNEDAPASIVSTSKGQIAMDEVQEVIRLPDFNVDDMMNQQENTESSNLSEEVKAELKDFILAIASSYRENFFHNFEHCSHVTMSMQKLLGRIVSGTASSSRDILNANSTSENAIEASVVELHRRTYGIASHPLTQFACVFSALIHDAGHTGVPNSRLAEESPEIASKYRKQSLAEQRSVDIAWELLMAPCYSNLRNCIFATQAEHDLFRQLVVNSVIATDIFDPKLGALRKSRWEKAFSNESTNQEEETMDVMNRKATIVIEHAIQASDVAHTMQHWHIYQRWNQRLFNEMYKAFEDGRSDKNPAEGWYGGELWFFDNYVIPLAKKLKDCGVFGVSSDEFLTYAMENRKEWENKGKEIVEVMERQYLKKSNGGSK